MTAVNFYPLTRTEQSLFTTLTNSRVKNEPVLILTQPTELLIGVDADDLQSPAYRDYRRLIDFDRTKIVSVDLDLIEGLDDAKASKKREILAWHTTILEVGFDTGREFFLSFDAQHRYTYAANVVFLEKGISRGSKQPSDSIFILDKNNIPRKFILSNLIEILIDHNEAYESIFNTHMVLLRALTAAETIADVDAIMVP